MIDTLLATIAPHLCCGCGKIGQLLCSSCKYNIISESFLLCFVCGRLTNAQGVCFFCPLPYRRAWCVGARKDELHTLLNKYKFHNAKAAGQTLAILLHERIGALPPDVVVVPIPTTASHVRQRGYDHTYLIARHFARMQKVTLLRPIERTGSLQQRGATRRQRYQQTKHAFVVRKQLSADTPYLLIDDIATTGATLTSAAKALKKAGAQTIWVATVAYQPLD